MEMFADPDARGGVLEPQGTVEIRFRQKDLIKAMHRCDNECKRLASKFSSIMFVEILTNSVPSFATELASDSTSHDTKNALNNELHERESMLMGMYHQVALYFADLHDTPARMYEKNCISEVVPWRTSRQYFYYLLKRRLYENRVKNEIQRVILNKNDAESSSMIRRWFIEKHGQHNVR